MSGTDLEDLREKTGQDRMVVSPKSRCLQYLGLTDAILYMVQLRTHYGGEFSDVWIVCSQNWGFCMRTLVFVHLQSENMAF